MCVFLTIFNQSSILTKYHMSITPLDDIPTSYLLIPYSTAEGQTWPTGLSKRTIPRSL